jgi:hypothetical protein
MRRPGNLWLRPWNDGIESLMQRNRPGENLLRVFLFYIHLIGIDEAMRTRASGQRRSIVIAKPPFRYRWTVGCQPDLVGALPFVPLLRSSAQHIRAPVAEENLRSAPATTGN